MPLDPAPDSARIHEGCAWKESALGAVDVTALEDLYTHYNCRAFVHPDPLEFLYNYADVEQREIVALVASSLAYGRVAQILKSVAFVLDRMGPPAALPTDTAPAALRERLDGFRHRFATADDMTALLHAAARTIADFGSLENCFAAGLKDGDTTVTPALVAFVDKLHARADGWRGHLLPSPRSGSACKRLNLFLRWMVRCDAVDVGGWDAVPPSMLVIPLDTHMHRIGGRLGFTSRKQANMRTAEEITAGFRRIVPEDPVRYDFALTRLGIRRDGDVEEFFRTAAAPA